MDQTAFDEINYRYRAVGRWWLARGGRTIDEDALVGIALLDLDLPAVIAALERMLGKAKTRPRSLAYFYAGLEEAEHVGHKAGAARTRRDSAPHSVAEMLQRRAAR